MAIGRLWAAETVWLTVVGGVLGLLTCQWLIGAIVALAPEGIPRLDEVTIDLPVAVFSVAVMALVTLLCGATPIRHASVVNLVETLNDGSRTRRRRPLVSHALVAAGAADRPRRRPAGRGRTGGAQLHGAAESRSRLHQRSGAADEGRAARSTARTPARGSPSCSRTCAR